MSSWALLRRKLVVDAETAEVYLSRLTLVGTPWFSIKLHRLRTPDPGRDLHDHPWWFASLVLWGSYLERMGPSWWERYPVGRGPVFIRGVCTRRVRWFNFKRAGTMHRIVSVAPRTWTLVLAGPRVRTWGFDTPAGWRPFEEVSAVGVDALGRTVALTGQRNTESNHA